MQNSGFGVELVTYHMPSVACWGDMHTFLSLETAYCLSASSLKRKNNSHGSLRVWEVKMISSILLGPF